MPKIKGKCVWEGCNNLQQAVGKKRGFRSICAYHRKHKELRIKKPEVENV